MAFKRPIKDPEMSLADSMKDRAAAKAAALQPRQAYGIGPLSADETHLKQSKHFQQTPTGAVNPIQRMAAPKKDDGLGKSAARMSKRFIGGQ